MATKGIWNVETRGIQPVPENEKSGTLGHVFWIWFAGNLSVVYVVFGAIIMSFALSLVQAVVVAIIGVLSFIVVGYFSIPGARAGVPTMTVSRAAFGTNGNVVPSLVSWLNMVGWETVGLVTATFAIESILAIAFGIKEAPWLIVLSLILAFVIAFLTAFLGYSTIARIQTIISYIFGALTVIAMGLLIPHIDGAKLLRIPSGHWLTGFVPAVSIIIAGTGLSWISTGSDYTRYLPAHTPPHKVAWATAWGGMIPTFFLMLFGILLFASMPQLLTAPNPTTILKDALPVWMAIPYLLAAAAGMIASDVLNIYSAGLSLQAANVKIPRTRTIILDAVISIGLSLFILLAAQNFLGTLEGLLTILAAALAPWAAIFLVDLLRHWKSGHMVSELFNGAQSRYGAVRGKTLIFWVLGFVISMLFTSIPGIFTGPLAVGIFNGSNLGFIVGFVVTWILTATLSRPSDKEALQSEAGTA